MPKDPVCGMTVDEKTKLKAELNGETYYFCGEHCLAKFLEDNPSAVKFAESRPAAGDVCPSCGVPGASGAETRPAVKILKNKTFLAAAALAAVVGASYIWAPLSAFREAFFMYAKKIWWALALGFALGGAIERFVPRTWITKTLSGAGPGVILRSVILGFLMSACSHGILALSVQLYKKGASPAAVVAFLMASPWANMAMTLMLVGFFGVKGLYIIAAAMFVAVTTGLVFQKLESKNLVEKNPHAAENAGHFSIISDAKARFANYKFSPRGLADDIKGAASGAAALADMVGWWILIGMGVSGTIAAYVPQHFVHAYFGPTLAGLIATLAVATVIEVCSEGSAPVAFEIFRQTGALGNSFVFLMAGVATDYTEIGILWTNIGKKTALWMVAVSVPQVLVLGYLANVFLR